MIRFAHAQFHIFTNEAARIVDLEKQDRTVRSTRFIRSDV